MVNDAINITLQYNTKQKVEGIKINVSYDTKTIIDVTLFNTNYLLIVNKIYPQPKVVQDNGILISHVTQYALKNIFIYQHVP